MSDERPVWGQGADCPHLPEWYCPEHGECRGCECGCDTANPPPESLEEADYSPFPEYPELTGDDHG